jgi:hypothetical protein
LLIVDGETSPVRGASARASPEGLIAINYQQLTEDRDITSIYANTTGKVLLTNVHISVIRCFAIEEIDIKF